MPTPHPPSAPTIELDFPIAIRKGICYHRLYEPFYTCLSSISSVSIPKFVVDALAHPGWHQAMLDDEMNALQNNGTWELVRLPSKKSVLGCR